MIRPNVPRYLADVLRVVALAPVTPGAVIHVTVWHDDSCGMLRGLAVCDCDPEVSRGAPTPYPRGAT